MFITGFITVEETLSMREWLIDCYPDQEEEIDQASDEDIWQHVERKWDGGLIGFLKMERSA